MSDGVKQTLPRGQAKAWRLLAVLVAAIGFFWVALLNGQPLFTPDSINYVRSPDIAVRKVLGAGYATAWSHRAAAEAGLAGSASVAGAGANAQAGDRTVQGGRSIYYSALAYAGLRMGGFWATVFLQGLVVALLVDIVVRGFGLVGIRTYAATALALICLTSIAFFASFLMPDIWAGVAILSMGALVGLQDRLKRSEALFLSLTVVYAALTHNSIVAVVLALTFAAGLYGLIARRSLGQNLAVGVGLAAVVAALVGTMAFGAAVTRLTGSPPGAPPFLMARLIADGPGTRFVREHCGAERFDVCRFAARFPMTSQQFLWGRAPDPGVVKEVSPDERRALSSEQFRFATAVLRDYPGETLYWAVRNSLLQAVTLEDADLNYDAGMRQTLRDAMPDGDYRAARESLSFRGAWPVRFLSTLQAGVALISLIAIGWLAILRAPPDNLVGAAKGFALLLIFGVLANAAVSGALSEVVGRYQARVVWVLPLGAIVLAATQARARRKFA